MKQRPEIPKTMAAVLLSGHGGLDKLTYRTDVRTPIPATGEVLIEIAAAGVNSTDINTRIAWYSKAVAAGTNARAAEGFAGADNIDGSWSGARMTFPRIRGADCCGRIVAVGEGVEPGRIGERAIVRTMLRSYVDYRPFECWTFGSECDGAFARCTKARESYKVSCNWSDAELASTPCAFSTAEGMLDRASVGAERILVTDASGGVGSAVVQLCKRRRAGGGGLQSS